MTRLWPRIAVPVYQAFCLVLLLLSAQNGALVHEFSHLAGAQHAALPAESSASNTSTCALCPSFAQASSPTFAHSFTLPSIVPAGVQLMPAPQIESADAPLPAARSRGPPHLS